MGEFGWAELLLSWTLIQLTVKVEWICTFRGEEDLQIKYFPRGLCSIGSRKGGISHFTIQSSTARSRIGSRSGLTIWCRLSRLSRSKLNEKAAPNESVCY